MRKSAVLVGDLVVVVVFAGVGRASHDENVLVGLIHTAWPFIVACLVGWGLVSWRKIAPASRLGYLLIWPITALGGLTIRLASGTSARWPFWIVATAFLGLSLGAWRLIARAVTRRRAATVRAR